MTTSPELPALSREAFVANVLWVGVTLACQGPIGGDLDFCGNRRRGEAHCNNGQGDWLQVLWDQHGVLVLVRDNYERAVPLDPPPPPDLRELVERAMSTAATGWLWICGDRSSPRLPPSQDSLLSFVDAFSGPPLMSSDEDYALERDLFSAIGDEPSELPAALVARLLDGPVSEMSGTRLEAARVMAESLSQFGLLWSTVERDVAERG